MSRIGAMLNNTVAKSVELAKSIVGAVREGMNGRMLVGY